MSDYEAPLDDLRWHWGDAYLIHFFEPDHWVAQRRDSHQTLRSHSPDGLRDLIYQDYTAHPVSRQIAGHPPAPPSCRFLPE